MQPRIVVLPRWVGFQFSCSRISNECLAHATARLNRNSVPFVRFVSNSQSNRSSTSRKSKRLSELRSLIQEYNDAYYSKGKPLVTDREYDKLFEELQQLEAAVEQATPSDSPTQTVGSSLTQTGDKKVTAHEGQKQDQEESVTTNNISLHVNGLVHLNSCWSMHSQCCHWPTPTMKRKSADSMPVYRKRSTMRPNGMLFLKNKTTFECQCSDQYLVWLLCCCSLSFAWCVCVCVRERESSSSRTEQSRTKKAVLL